MKLKSVSGRKKKLNTESDDRTIYLLIAILLLFIVSELPMSIFYVLFLFDRSKYYIATTSFYTFAITTCLFNASLNMILYCAMLEKFRSTFMEIFINPIKIRITDTSETSMSKQTQSIEMSSK